MSIARRAPYLARELGRGPGVREVMELVLQAYLEGVIAVADERGAYKVWRMEA